MDNMSVIPEFRSIGKEIEQFAIALCPYFEKALFLMFFGLLFAIAHYCLLVIATRQMEMALWVRGACFAVAVWCVFNIIFNYLMTVMVAPGTPSDIPQGLLSQINVNCRRCGVIKPPRTHHCSICNRCVIQMDHHCPWVGTCVGHHNRKYFINFLTYTTLGLAQMLLFLRLKEEAMIYVLVVTLLTCLALFSAYHWYITLVGKTSLEICWDDPRYRPSPSIAHNLRIVYGTSNILKCLLPSISVLKNPGHHWDAI